MAHRRFKIGEAVEGVDSRKLAAALETFKEAGFGEERIQEIAFNCWECDACHRIRLDLTARDRECYDGTIMEFLPRWEPPTYRRKRPWERKLPINSISHNWDNYSSYCPECYPLAIQKAVDSVLQLPKRSVNEFLRVLSMTVDYALEHWSTQPYIRLVNTLIQRIPPQGNKIAVGLLMGMYHRLGAI